MSLVNVVLIKQVKNLGKIGDKVSVKNGYAKNFLVPKKKARFATEEVCNEIQEKLAQLENKNKELIQKSIDIKERIHQSDLEISCVASQSGQLFGSIKSKDIVNAIKKSFDLEISKDSIKLLSPIKSIGKYEVEITLHPEIVANVNVKIVYSQSNA